MAARCKLLFMATMATLLLLVIPATCLGPAERPLSTLAARASPPRSRPTSPTTGLLSDVKQHVAKNAEVSRASATHSGHTSSSAQASHSTSHASQSAGSHAGSGSVTPAGHSLHYASGKGEGDAGKKRIGRPLGAKNKVQRPVYEGPKNKPYTRTAPTPKTGPWWKKPGGQPRAPPGAGKKYEEQRAYRDRLKAKQQGKSTDTHPSEHPRPGGPHSPGSPGGGHGQAVR